MVHIIKFAKNKSVRTQLQPLELVLKSIVIIPVNNGKINGEGTHWSLLLFIPKEGKFYHIDTLGGTNKHRSQAIVKKLLCALKEVVPNYYMIT